MAYSKQVVERFESVLKNPEKHELVIFDDISLHDLENLISKFSYNSWITGAAL